MHQRLVISLFKVRQRWFGSDFVKLQYLCHLSWDLNVLYVKRKVILSSNMQYMNFRI